jgi:hypothetical protein
MLKYGWYPSFGFCVVFISHFGLSMTSFPFGSSLFCKESQLRNVAYVVAEKRVECCTWSRIDCDAMSVNSAYYFLSCFFQIPCLRHFSTCK